MHRRFAVWLLVVASCLLATVAALLATRTVSERAERAWRESLLLAAPTEAALAALEPRPEHLPYLLRRSLSEGQPQIALELLRDGREIPHAHPVYAAAALFELGRDDESQRIWPGDPERSGFEGRLQEARRFRQRGAETLVRDRRGRLLGAIDANGVFLRSERVPEALLPPSVLEPILRASPEEAAKGVRLGLDLELSLLARDALGDHRGSIVMVEVASGTVIVAVSDATSFAAATGGAPALAQRREPASIAKLLTVSAALRAGIDADAEIAAMHCRGAIRLDGEPLYCSSVDGPLRGLDHALSVSCNVAFAELGALVGGERLVEEYRRYGFAVGDEEGHALFGRVHRNRHGARQLGDLAIGLDEADITPLHAALLASAMARGEVLPPRWVAALDGLLGLSPRPVSVPLRTSAAATVLGPDGIGLLQRAMAHVVAPGGTAAWVDSPRFPVAMKTGTGRDPGRYFHINYIGIGPMPEPWLAFAVRITDGRTSRRVRRAGYGVTRDLLAGLGVRYPAEATQTRIAGHADRPADGLAGFGD